ncbi:unnamed protein product [Caenorhabditis brenneri]
MPKSNFESDLPKTEPPGLMALPTTPSKRKFPILRLPFVAQKNVLLRLELNDLIPLSFLSKRSKQMIKQALPSPKKAQCSCIVWPRAYPVIKVSSRFGSYTGSSVDHIIEVLSDPPIRVVLQEESAVAHATEWMKNHQQIVKEIIYPACCMRKNDEDIVEFINEFIELNVRIQLGNIIAIVPSQEEVRIEDPNISLLQCLPRLNCRKLRIVDRNSPFLAEIFMYTLDSSDIGEPKIEQLIFEVKESPNFNYRPLFSDKKCKKEWQHPIYGKIKVHYKINHVSRKLILFETHHDGKKLLVVDIK